MRISILYNTIKFGLFATPPVPSNCCDLLQNSEAHSTLKTKMIDKLELYRHSDCESQR
jgi:hypothetical protein